VKIQEQQRFLKKLPSRIKLAQKHLKET